MPLSLNTRPKKRAKKLVVMLQQVPRVVKPLQLLTMELTMLLETMVIMVSSIQVNILIDNSLQSVIWICQKWEKQFGLDPDFKIQDTLSLAQLLVSLYYLVLR